MFFDTTKGSSWAEIRRESLEEPIKDTVEGVDMSDRLSCPKLWPFRSVQPPRVVEDKTKNSTTARVRGWCPEVCLLWSAFGARGSPNSLSTVRRQWGGGGEGVAHGSVHECFALYSTRERILSQASCIYFVNTERNLVKQRRITSWAFFFEPKTCSHTYWYQFQGWAELNHHAVIRHRH